MSKWARDAMKDAVNLFQHDDLDAFEKKIVAFPRVFSDLAASPGEESSLFFSVFAQATQQSLKRVSTALVPFPG